VDTFLAAAIHACIEMIQRFAAMRPTCGTKTFASRENSRGCMGHGFGVLHDLTKGPESGKVRSLQKGFHDPLVKPEDAGLNNEKRLIHRLDSPGNEAEAPPRAAKVIDRYVKTRTAKLGTKLC
jgi:hypothetical protein